MLYHSCLFVSLICITGQADDAHRIRIRQPARGDVLKVVDETSLEHGYLVTVDGEERKKQTTKSGSTVAYVETILEKAQHASRPTRLKRKYEKARQGRAGAERPLAYEGATVLIEQRKDKYHFRLADGKELTGTDAAALTTEFNLLNGLSLEAIGDVDSVVPVKVGASWKIDAGKLFRAIDRDKILNVNAADGLGELLEVYQKHGHPWARLRITLEAPMAPTRAGKDTFKVAPGSQLKLVVHTNACIDGTSVDTHGSAELTMDIISIARAGGREVKALSNIKCFRTVERTKVPGR